MTYFIAGLIAVIVFSGALNAFLGTNPKWLSTQLRRVGGVAVILFGLFLLSRGQFELAVPAFIAGATLLGLFQNVGIPGFGQRQSKTPGQTSTVRSAFLDMTLDHDTGRMAGRFVKGSLAGQLLDDLDVARLLAAFSELDGESAALLEAYLDRREPRWREHGQARTNGGGAGAAPGLGAMTDQEAHEILGLQPGASEEAIRAAHRALMKKIHPDQGGSTWLATRVNQAKDVLLKRHGRNS